MSVRIDHRLCINCGKCAAVCPGNLIKRNPDGKIFLRRPDDCWSCTSCLKECPVGAISLFLGPELGGRGSTLQAGLREGAIDWKITAPDGSIRIITTNTKESNKY